MKRSIGSKAGSMNLRAIWVAVALVVVSSASASGGISSLYERYSPAKQFPLSVDCHLPKTAKDGAGNMTEEQQKSLAGKNGYIRTVHNYALPETPLLTMNGKKTTLEEELETDKPVMLNFIFTTCTTICPVLSASFYQIQHELGEESQDVKMISISIDPEFDTPEKLRRYAERFNAGPQWQFLTGEVDDIITVEKAFDAFRGAKMNHEPLTLIRARDDDVWLRIDGIASAEDILAEYRKLMVR